MMKNFTIFSTFLVFATLTFGNPTLSIRIHSESSSFYQDQAIFLKITLTNEGNSPVFIPARLKSSSPFLDVSVFDSEGHDLSYRNEINSKSTPNLNGNERSKYVLKPNGTLNHNVNLMRLVLKDSHDEYFKVDSRVPPGKYSAVTRYYLPVPGTGEYETVISEAFDFEITPTPDSLVTEHKSFLNLKYAIHNSAKGNPAKQAELLNDYLLRYPNSPYRSWVLLNYVYRYNRISFDERHLFPVNPNLEQLVVSERSYGIEAVIRRIPDMLPRPENKKQLSDNEWREFKLSQLKTDYPQSVQGLTTPDVYIVNED